MGSGALVVHGCRSRDDASFGAMMEGLRAAGPPKFWSTASTHAGKWRGRLGRAECRGRARLRAGSVDPPGVGGGSCLGHGEMSSVSCFRPRGPPAGLLTAEHKVSGPRYFAAVGHPHDGGDRVRGHAGRLLSDAEAKALKVRHFEPLHRADGAIGDPDLTLTCPAGLTAIAGADALTHAIEAFTAIRREPVAGIAQERGLLGKNAIFRYHFAPWRDRAAVARAGIGGGLWGVDATKPRGGASRR